MRRFFDGLQSALAVFVTLFVTGVPIFGTVQAIRYGFMPPWAWAAVVGLGLVALIMTLSLGRKAIRGVHPLRDRRR